MVMQFGSKNGYLLHQNTTLQVLNWRAKSGEVVILQSRTDYPIYIA